jgi:hypothetical protein
MTLPLQLPGSPLSGASGLPLINTAIGAELMPGHGLGAAISSNNFTVQLLGNDSGGGAPSSTVPAVIGFRNVSLISGVPSFLTCSTSLTFTINSGNTMGAANGVPFRLWVVLFNNGGTPVLGAINCLIGPTVTQIVPLDEGSLQSATGSNGGSSAGVFYAAAAITSKSFRILGYMEWSAGLTTAGTWDAGPSKIKIFGPGDKKPGDIVQAVLATQNSASATTSSTMAASNLAATITPTAACNPVEARAVANVTVAGTATTLQAEIRRGTTTRVGMAGQFKGAANALDMMVLEGIDAPGVASATIYTVYRASSDNATSASFPAASYANPAAQIRLQELMG